MRVLTALLLATVLAGCGAGGPNIRAETKGTALKVTADDDSPVTIRRVVINGRRGQLGCDTSYSAAGLVLPQLPARLAQGDILYFIGGYCDGKIRSAVVDTDRGNISFRL